MKTKNLLFVIVMTCLPIVGFGQTWNAGYPNEADVTVTLSDGTLTVRGTGATRDYGYINGKFDYSPWDSSEEIESIVIEEGITTIGEDFFWHLSNLTSVVMPDGITSIGYWAFFDCPKLTSIRIPGSVRYIGMDAFGADEGLQDVFVEWEDPNVVTYDDYIFEGVNISLVVLHVPVGTKAVYQNHEVWKEFIITESDNIVNTQLANLTVSIGKLSPEFSPAIHTYNVAVPNSIDNITITATPMEGTAVSGDGRKTLSIGINSFEITVIDGDISSVYTVYVTREATDFTLQALSYNEVTTGTLTVTYFDMVTNANKTVPVIDLCEVEYELSTGTISGNLPLHFDVENGKKTYDAEFNVNANSIYKFTLYVGINHAQGDISFTTHYNAYGQPSSTTMSYSRHTCDVVASSDNVIVSATEINRPGTATTSISVSDLAYIGSGNFSSINELSVTPSVNIFPNPVSDFITIAGLQAGKTVRIYDISGSLLLTTSESTIDLSSYPKGMYLVRVGNKTAKVVKK